MLILVVFNSTLVDWSDSASLVDHRHRQFAILLMVRVDFVEFPQGLLSPHFSSTLVDFKVQLEFVIRRANRGALARRLAEFRRGAQSINARASLSGQ